MLLRRGLLFSLLLLNAASGVSLLPGQAHEDAPASQPHLIVDLMQNVANHGDVLMRIRSKSADGQHDASLVRRGKQRVPDGLGAQHDPGESVKATQKRMEETEAAAKEAEERSSMHRFHPVRTCDGDETCILLGATGIGLGIGIPFGMIFCLVLALAKHCYEQRQEKRLLKEAAAAAEAEAVEEDKYFEFTVVASEHQLGFLTTGEAPKERVYVSEVDSGSWAEGKGIQVGDELLLLGGQIGARSFRLPLPKMTNEDFYKALKSRPVELQLQRCISVGSSTDPSDQAGGLNEEEKPEDVTPPAAEEAQAAEADAAAEAADADSAGFEP